MKSLYEMKESVCDPDTFSKFVEMLRSEIDDPMDNPNGSTNATLDHFLESMGAWVNDARPNMIEDLIEKPNRWQAMAELLYIGLIYE